MADHWHDLLAAHVGAVEQLPGDARARAALLDDLREQGLPDRRDEQWRYTRVSRYLTPPFTLGNAAPTEVSEPDIAPIAAALEPAALVVLVDGRYRPELSRPGSGQDGGLRLQTLSEWLVGGAAVPESRDHGEDPEAGVFERLNAAFAVDGAVLETDPGYRSERPVVVLHLHSGAAVGRVMHTRLQVRCGQDSALSVVEIHQGDCDGPSLATAVTHAAVAHGALLRHIRVQVEDHQAVRFTHLRLVQEPESRVEGLLFGARAGLGRHEVSTDRLGTGAVVDLRAFLLARGRQQQELHTRVRHAEPDARSFVQCKCVADDRARGVFNGRVLVQPGADGTDARVANANLLLSADAEVDTKPELEIYADDVKCSHGATVGQLDAAQLFYLRSRGLTLTEARALLLGAFAGELFDAVGDEAVRAVVSGRVREALEGLGVTA